MIVKEKALGEKDARIAKLEGEKRALAQKIDQLHKSQEELELLRVQAGAFFHLSFYLNTESFYSIST